MMGGVLGQERPQPSPVDALVEMGFSREVAIGALEAASNNFDNALQVLLDQRETEERNRRASAAERRFLGTSNAFTTRTNASTTRTSVSRHQPASLAPKPVPPQPKVQELSDAIRSFADQYQAVDTLHYVLKTLIDNPNEAKYRSLKTSNARFVETLGKDPRVLQQIEHFMNRIGFERAGEWLSVAPNYDRSKIEQAVEALENVQRNDEVYGASKRRGEFENAIELSRASATEEERSRRAVFAAKLPLIPIEGAAGTTRITVVISEGAPSLFRRFVADDTLRDVIHWIGSERSIVANKLLESSWSLVDETLLQKKVIGVDDFDKTLHALGLWPSATLYVRLPQ